MSQPSHKKAESAASEIRKEIASRLRECRASGHLQLKDVSEHVSLDPRQLTRWESGEAPDQLLRILKLSELYGVSVDYLLGKSSDRDGIPRGIILVDIEMVEALLAANTLEDLKEWQMPEGFYPGQQVPEQVRAMRLVDFERLQKRIRAHIRALGKKTPRRKRSKDLGL